MNKAQFIAYLAPQFGDSKKEAARAVEVGGRLDGFDRAEDLAGAEGLTGFREVDERDVPEGGLRVVGDPDGGRSVRGEPDPLVVLGVMEVGGDVAHGFWVRREGIISTLHFTKGSTAMRNGIRFPRMSTVSSAEPV